MSTPLSASWKPRWYNLDQSLAVGRRDAFALSLPGPGTQQEVVFATWGESTYWMATVVAMTHSRFGPVDEVDATSFGSTRSGSRTGDGSPSRRRKGLGG
ncbi:hypothetical protein GC089_18030 [Cellulomonas sp. JZ18]|uniref:hypothetical protein n=1 Tax=Cellulomonas sp. JZ18 TaxID=2654191 RepID=UPI0012D4BAE6|nr:hypothetical protein [Cellulomonas sp. JZ18]QGQ20742.1 hypothetical protein GC089_18030 [Cellulomonas sp. JZ18]